MKLFVPLLLFGCITALPATDDPIPAPSISGAPVQYSGNGCPQGTVSATVQPNPDGPPGSYHLVATLTNVTVRAPPGSSVPRISKHCAIYVNVKVPDEWQISVNAGGTDVRGYMWLLDESMTGHVEMQYELSTLDGPVSGSLRWRGRYA
jgi:hypothetical protein